ncbi:hypothetical protein GQ600_25105 [Phytophthora cactorum]|nr:hypothetical protein GQ600_25105 [Phytophthora cactorum]
MNATALLDKLQPTAQPTQTALKAGAALSAPAEAALSASTLPMMPIMPPVSNQMMTEVPSDEQLEMVLDDSRCSMRTIVSIWMCWILLSYLLQRRQGSHNLVASIPVALIRSSSRLKTRRLRSVKTMRLPTRVVDAVSFSPVFAWNDVSVAISLTEQERHGTCSKDAVG